MSWLRSNEAAVALTIVAFGAAVTLATPHFLTSQNIFTLLLNATVVALLAIGQTFVLLTAGIDLSVGSGIALSGVVIALTIGDGIPWPVAIGLGLLSALLVGISNGLVIHYARIPAFIATLAMMGVAASIPLIITGGLPVAISVEAFAQFAGGFVWEIPIPVLVAIGLALVAAHILRNTRGGRHVYATGSNRSAARRAGIRIGRVELFVYALSGLMSGLAGAVDASRLVSGVPTAGSGNELFYSIAAAVVGGVSLFGGKGTMLGAMLGALLIGEIEDGLNVLNVSSFWQPLIIGLIILFAVALDAMRTSRRTGLPWRVLLGHIGGLAGRSAAVQPPATAARSGSAATLTGRHASSDPDTLIGAEGTTTQPPRDSRST